MLNMSDKICPDLHKLCFYLKNLYHVNNIKCSEMNQLNVIITLLIFLNPLISLSILLNGNDSMMTHLAIVYFRK